MGRFLTAWAAPYLHILVVCSGLPEQFLDGESGCGGALNVLEQRLDDNQALAVGTSHLTVGLSPLLLR